MSNENYPFDMFQVFPGTVQNCLPTKDSLLLMMFMDPVTADIQNEQLSRRDCHQNLNFWNLVTAEMSRKTFLEEV